MNWIKKALCKLDENSHRWVSYKLSDINYAKDICDKCPVTKECMMYSELVGMYGVVAGLSELDRLNIKWKEAKSLNESNWE